jgi:hypothetical protein
MIDLGPKQEPMVVGHRAVHRLLRRNARTWTIDGRAELERRAARLFCWSFRPGRRGPQRAHRGEGAPFRHDPSRRQSTAHADRRVLAVGVPGHHEASRRRFSACPLSCVNFTDLPSIEVRRDVCSRSVPERSKSSDFHRHTKRHFELDKHLERLVRDLESGVHGVRLIATVDID